MFIAGEDMLLTVTAHLLVAVLVGALIGLERSFHGRPAGFRTHALVSTASALLMLVTVYQVALLPALPIETVRVDPTRMAQGIMTGIGFLGAGVIMKEGLTVRGLTTAASIWITAAIGILIGLGFYYPALLATALTLGTLAVFRWIESSMPSLDYARLVVRFPRGRQLSLDELNDMVSALGISAANVSYHLQQNGRLFEYQMTVRTRDQEKFRELAERLSAMDEVEEFELSLLGGK